MFSALRFLTILPLPAHIPHAKWLTRHGWQATFTGIFIGILCAIPATLAVALSLPAPLSAALVIVCSIVLSGALHEDGLADTADSLGAPKDRRLQIMHDPRCGTFAVLALIVSLAAKISALIYLFFSLDFFTPLILTHAAARSAFPLWCRFLKPHPKTGLARLLDNTTPNAFSVLSPFFLTAILAFALLSAFSAAIFLATLTTCSLLLLLFFRRKFTFLSGDLCGFGEQILECALLFCLCALY